MLRVFFQLLLLSVFSVTLFSAELKSEVAKGVYKNQYVTFEYSYNKNNKKQGLETIKSIKTGKILKTNHWKNGKLHGVQTSYFDNGKIEKTVKYVDGKKSGVEKSYYQSGAIKSEKNYLKGKDDGAQKSYYENGRLEHEVSYRNDKAVGISKQYYENGKLSRTYEYKSGIEKNYYKNGKLQEESVHVNNKLDGIQVNYYENGEQNKRHYKNGVIIKDELYDAKGVKKLEKIFKNGKVDKIVEFSKDGKKLQNNKLTYKLREGGKITKEDRNGVEKTFYDKNGKIVAVYNESKRRYGTFLTCKEFKNGILEEIYNFNNEVLRHHTRSQKYTNSIFKNTPFSKIFPQMNRTYPNAVRAYISESFDDKSNSMVTKVITINDGSQDFYGKSIARFDNYPEEKKINVNEWLQRDGKEENHSFYFESEKLVRHDYKKYASNGDYIEITELLDRDTGKMVVQSERKKRADNMMTYSIVETFKEKPTVIKYTFSGTFKSDNKRKYLTHVKDAYYMNGQKKYHEEKDYLTNKTVKQEWDEKGKLLKK